MTWNWCLYESGFYVGRRLDPSVETPTATPNRKSVVLHSPDIDPPAPLKRWQAVRATRDDVRAFLTDLFSLPLGDNPEGFAPELPFLAAFPDTVSAIVNLVGPKPVREYFTRYLIFHLTEPMVSEMARTSKLSGDILIESDADSLELFGRRGPVDRLRWGDFAGHLQLRAAVELQHWDRSLARKVVDAIANHHISTELPLFRSVDDRVYYSKLHILDRFGAGSFSAYVIFSEVLPEHDPRPEGELGVLSNMLTIARYFRGGICDPFLNQVVSLKTTRSAPPAKVRQVMEGLQAALDVSINRSAVANLLDRRTAVGVMTEEADQVEMAEIYEEWEKMSGPFMDAIDDGQVEAVLEGLETLQDLNARFMLLVVRRYHEELRRFFGRG